MRWRGCATACRWLACNVALRLDRRVRKTVLPRSSIAQRRKRP